MHEKQNAELVTELKKLLEVNGLSVKPSRFAVYVPTRLSSGSEIHPDRYRVLLSVAKKFLCETLGGLTSYKAKGAWVDKTDRLHEEKVMVLESFCALEKLIKSAKDLREFANALAIEFEQSQMACVVDGEMVFFEPTKIYREKHEWIAVKATPAERKLDSVVWRHVLGPLKEAGIPSVFGPLN